MICSTPMNSGDKFENLLLKSVWERVEGCILEWVLHKLEDFGPFLGLSYEGFEVEIIELFNSIEYCKLRNDKVDGSSLVGGKRLLKELKKLESSINYDRKVGGSKEVGESRGEEILFK